jgi:translation initiation factor IF-3
MARPPVCKLMDYGKFKYESALKARESRKNQAQTVIKEIKLRPKIDPHDYGTKKGHVERFLKAGDKVKVTIMFRGREQSRPELGFKLLQKLAADVEELGFVESTPKQDGRNMIMVIGPHKRKTDAMAAARAERASRSRGSGQDDLGASAGIEAAAEAYDQDGAFAPPAAESPVTESPVTESPVAESPVAESPVAESPAAESPAAESPAAESPVPESPATEQPASKPASSAPASSGAPSASPASPASPARAGSAGGTSAAPRPAAPRPQPRPGPGAASAAPKPTAPRTAASPAPRPGAGSAAPKPTAPRGTAAAARSAGSGSAAGAARPVPSPRPMAPGKVAADKPGKPSAAKASPEGGDSES